jgi:hypothetical protein
MKKTLCVLALLLFTVSAFAQTEAATTFATPNQRGVFKLYSCADPAAGAEISCTVPAGKIWRVVSLRVALVTSSGVANRFPSITVDDGTTVFYQIISPTAHTASLTWTYNFSAVPSAASAGNTVGLLPAPQGTLLGAGYRILSVTTAIQAGDNYGAPVVFVEEWNK